ncbi:MAG TPA: putative Ig domain-containing protein [Candidatus Acidoferrales bacterium]|nr:putative Ig domain-containing protein [Candidatus Acidoferrales bacterium]
MFGRVGFSFVVGVLLTCVSFAGCAGTPASFRTVVLSPNTAQTIGAGQSVVITAQVLNDTSNAGVAWTLAPASGTGTLSPTTSASATYNAPASVTVATTVAVKATSVAFPNQSATLTITVEPPPAITTTSLPSGSINGTYSGTVNASGGVPPYSWSVASGSLPPGLSLAPSTSNSVTISGTPTSQGTSTFTIKVTDSSGAFATSASLTITVGNLAITTASPLPPGSVGTPYSVQFAASGGTAPDQWSVATGSALPAGLMLSAAGLLSGTPTVQATATFGVTVTDSEVPPASVTRSFGLTIGTGTGVSLLKGNYAFEFSGFHSGEGVVVAGSFVADGAGNLKSGVEDFNTIAGPPKNQTFTGTYTLGSDNRGTLTLNLPGSITYVYAFAIDPTGAHARIIQFDASGIRGSGKLEKQSVATCASNTISGDYAFGISGSAAALGGFTAGPVAVAGRFTAAPPALPGGVGSLSNGETDANTPGFVTPIAEITSGTFQTTSQAARCTATISPANLPSLTFSVYPVSASEFFLVETDAVSSNTPFLSAGELMQQVGSPFTSPSGGFTGASVAGLTGQFLSGSTYVPDVAVVSLTSSGLNNFALSITENQAGTVGTAAGNGSFVNADQFGRVATNLISPIAPVFYMINQNEAFCVGEINNDPFFGIFEPQSAGPFTASAIKGSFVQGTSAPATSPARDLSGVIALDGTTKVAGTQDQSTGSSNLAGQAVTGTYAVTSAAAGSGTVTLTAPSAFTGSFLIVSPTQLVMVTTTAGDVNPVLIFLGN